jgi:ribosome maturation protein SDO1
VNEKERDHDLGALRREIATLVAEKCVDPATQRPHPVGMVEKGMAESGFSVKPGKSAKSQVAECGRLLQEKSTLPIQRARMRVRVVVPGAQADAVKARIIDGAEKVEDEKTGDEWEAVGPRISPENASLTECQTLLIDPAQFRVITELLSKECKGKGRIETLTISAAAAA